MSDSVHVPLAMALVNRVLDMSRSESERGMVVLAMAFVEERLGVLVQKRHNLSGCIHDAKANGLLEDNTIENLHNLRWARNKFAHNWDVGSLDHVEVKPFVDKLIVKPDWTMPGRVHSKSYVSSVLAYTAVEINRQIIKLGIEPVYPTP
ncbi:hypothetical protein [Paracidovorax citrulli]|uniref:hypothetical protein n=1 Tax=Paracidovorax citrulli TaxID=80869 RepID=UPI003FA69B3B